MTPASAVLSGLFTTLALGACGGAHEGFNESDDIATTLAPLCQSPSPKSPDNPLPVVATYCHDYQEYSVVTPAWNNDSCSMLRLATAEHHLLSPAAITGRAEWYGHTPTTQSGCETATLELELEADRCPAPVCTEPHCRTEGCRSHDVITEFVSASTTGVWLRSGTCTLALSEHLELDHYLAVRMRVRGEEIVGRGIVQQHATYATLRASRGNGNCIGL